MCEYMRYNCSKDSINIPSGSKFNEEIVKAVRRRSNGAPDRLYSYKS